MIPTAFSHSAQPERRDGKRSRMTTASVGAMCATVSEASPCSDSHTSPPLAVWGVTRRERNDQKEPEACARPAARSHQHKAARAVAGERHGAATGGLDVRTAIVSTFPPRACGIGTFAADLRGTLVGAGTVEVVDLVAVVHEPSSPQRPGLLATIAQAVRGDYVRTARMLGRLDVDVVLLQHEYGIFGGRDGEYVLSFAQELAQPLVMCRQVEVGFQIEQAG